MNLMCAGIDDYATAPGRDDNLGYDAEKISTNNSKGNTFRTFILCMYYIPKYCF